MATTSNAGLKWIKEVIMAHLIDGVPNFSNLFFPTRKALIETKLISKVIFDEINVYCYTFLHDIDYTV